MRTLALETSGNQPSLAALEGERLLREVLLPTGRRTAATFSIALGDLMASLEWRFPSLEVVAVTTGPGSFTGLRIGVTAAKTLAYACGTDVVGVNTLETIAEGVFADPRCAEARSLWTVLDAQRQELFAALYEKQEVEGSDSSIWRETKGTSIMPREAWLAELREGQHVAGPVLDKLKQQLPEGVRDVPRELWSPSAAATGRLALRRYAQGERDDLWQLVPQYYRKSAAEEKTR